MVTGFGQAREVAGEIGMEYGPTIASMLRRGYVEFADQVAIRHLTGDTTSYAQLGATARRLVTGLQGLGVQKGDRVALLTKNRPESVVTDHSLYIGGFVRVPLSYRLHAREVLDILEDSGAAVLVLDSERVEDVVPLLGDFAGTVICVDEVPGVTHLSKVIADVEADDVEISPLDIASMPYTSGTSGRPKGVMQSHGSVLSILRNMMVELPPAHNEDVVAHAAPFSHFGGWVMLAYCTKGASHVPLDQFRPPEFLSAVEKVGATVLPLAPTMINMLLPVVERLKPDISSIRAVIYGGSAIAPDRLARAISIFGPVFVQFYGLTEIPFIASLSMRDHIFDQSQPVPTRLASAGRLTPFVDFRLVDDDGRAAAARGEIQLRGDSGMVGYWGLPEETAATILPGGWISTGDVGELIDGFLHVVDRKKNLIVSGGFNVYPTEVENALYTLEAVHEVAVIGVPSEKWGESVHAVIVLTEGHELTTKEIEDVCRDRIAPYKRPRSVDFVEELPKTTSGKIMHRVIRAQYWRDQARRVGG